MSLTFKRHYHLFIFLVLITVLLLFGLGDHRIIAYTVPDNAPVMAYLVQARIAGLLGALGIR